MEKPAVVYKGAHRGKLPRTNDMHGTSRNGRIFVTASFKKRRADMAASFSTTRPTEPIDYKVDCRLRISQWQVIDSDASVKGIFDALEMAGVVENDKQIRDFRVIRDYHKRDDDDTVRVTLYVTSMRRGA